jgi:hypothetical protein
VRVERFLRLAHLQRRWRRLNEHRALTGRWEARKQTGTDARSSPGWPSGGRFCAALLSAGCIQAAHGWTTLSTHGAILDSAGCLRLRTIQLRHRPAGISVPSEPQTFLSGWGADRVEPGWFPISSRAWLTHTRTGGHPPVPGINTTLAYLQALRHRTCFLSSYYPQGQHCSGKTGLGRGVS